MNKTPVITLLLSFIALALGGCAHSTKKKEEAPQSLKLLLETNSTPAANEVPQSAKNYSELEVAGVKLQNTQFDYPVTINSAVELWVSYFTGKGRKHFERYLERSEYFIPYIEPILKQNGLPTDLVYQAMIESGFSNHARSWAKAVGPWQFIPETGKRYGLQVNWWVDERRDTERSTQAAVRYLKELYLMFGSWELASAAYNAGENKIAKAIDMHSTRDFWQMTRYRYLKPETKNYVPKIIAAAIVAKNRTQFGFPARYTPEVQASASKPANVAVAPALDETATPLALKELLADNAEEDELAAEDELPPARWSTPPQSSDDSVAQTHMPHVDKKGEVSYTKLAQFEIQGPADLQRVASAAGLSYAELKSLNPHILRWVTSPFEKTVKIRLPESSKEKFLQAYNHPAFPREVKFLSYTPKKTESLKKIAKRWGIKADPIYDLNGIPASAGFAVRGSKILVPLPANGGRSIASLEIVDPPEVRRRRSRRARYTQQVSYRPVNKTRRGI